MWNIGHMMFAVFLVRSVMFDFILNHFDIDFVLFIEH